jgi:rhodanese-related sulfurtransferase
VNFFLETNNLLLIAIAVSSGLLLLWPFIQQTRGGKALSTAQVIQMINHQNGLVVDIRPLATYQNGHVVDSRNLPPADLATKGPALPKGRPIILACDRGQTAFGAAAKLRKMGFEQVYVMQGGINAWAQAGLPLSTKR